MNCGLVANDAITVSHTLDNNLVMAIVELNHVTYDKVFDFVGSDDTMLATVATRKSCSNLLRTN